MFNFKDMIAKDLDIFVNLDELASSHKIEEKEVICVIDSDMLTQRQGGAEFGIAESDMIVFAKTAKLEEKGIKKKSFGAHMNVDGREFTVISWSDNIGMSQITLTQAVMN